MWSVYAQHMALSLQKPEFILNRGVSGYATAFGSCGTFVALCVFVVTLGVTNPSVLISLVSHYPGAYHSSCIYCLFIHIYVGFPLPR